MEEEAARPSSHRWLTVLRWVAFAACIALFIHTLARSNLAAAWGRIEAIGPLAVVAVVPFPFALAMDAWAWKGLLAALGRKASWRTLFVIRIGTEAVTNSAPVGAVWADAISPLLVHRRAGVPIADVFAASTAKRWTVVRMHGGYVAICAAFGASSILHASRVLLHGSEVLLPTVFAAATGLVLLSIAIEAIASRGKIAGRVSGVLGGARFKRLTAWVEARHHHFARADVQLARLSKDKRAAALAAWRMLGLWIFEGLESYVLFRLLGAPLGLIEVLSFDAALSVVRSSAMFAPGGIGVQDVGYLAVLQAYGVPDAASIGPAFVVLKRLKETFWIAIGFGVLARSGPRDVILHPENAEDPSPTAAQPAGAPSAASAQSAAQEPPAAT